MVRVHDATVAGLVGDSGGVAAASAAGAAGAAGAASGARGIAKRGPNRRGSARVPVRVYEPEAQELRGRDAPWGTLVWAHGGSFMRGTLDWPEADWVARRFAEAGLRVYSVDYALASGDVKAPAPSNDVLAVLRATRDHHDGVVCVGGASAGGQLAAIAALAQSEFAASSGDKTLGADALLLVYPTLHRVQRADASILELTSKLPEERRFAAERIAQMYSYYLGEDPSPSTAEVIGELPPERLAALPPTVIVNADADDLRASAEQFDEQLREAGVEVRSCLQPGTVHGYLNRPEESAAARRDAQATIDSLVQGLRGILGETQNVDSGASARAAQADPPAAEPAIAAPVSLTLPNGRLNREAIGWAPQPIIDTSGIGRGRGRNKRWEYWNVVTPSHIVGLTVSHIDYACVPEVWIYDRETEATHHATATVIPPRGTVLAATLEQGRSMARAKDLSIDIEEVDGGTRLRCEIPGASLDLVAALLEGHERLALVVPWSDTRFQYTVKDLARPVTGWLRVNGSVHEVGGESGESWATLDHGRGRWPYDISWNWGAGSGRSGGRRLGVQLGAKWTDGTGVSENAFFVDGRMHKIHGDTRWEYDLEDWRAPWRVTGGGLDATFAPFHNKRTRTDLLILQGHTDQCFGHWSGTFETAEGETIDFAGLVGWAEEVHNRW